MINNPLLGDKLSGADPVALIQTVIVTLVNLAYVAGVVIFFFMLVFGGIQWIGSGGDKAAVANAKGRIMNAVIGLTILLSVFAIVTIIEAAFGISILRLDIGALSIGGSPSSCVGFNQPCSSTPCCSGSGLVCAGTPLKCQ